MTMRKIIFFMGLFLFFTGCESDSGSSGSPSSSGDSHDTRPSVTEEGDSFRWAFDVHVKNQNNLPIGGAEVSIRITGRTVQYLIEGRTNHDGWVSFNEDVYPYWQAVITVYKAGYQMQSITVQAGRQSIYFYLPVRYVDP